MRYYINLIDYNTDQYLIPRMGLFMNQSYSSMVKLSGKIRRWNFYWNIRLSVSSTFWRFNTREELNVASWLTQKSNRSILYPQNFFMLTLEFTINVWHRNYQIKCINIYTCILHATTSNFSQIHKNLQSVDRCFSSIRIFLCKIHYGTTWDLRSERISERTY